MPGFWDWFMRRIGAGPTQEEELDQAAVKMHEDLQVRLRLATTSVANARTVQRELAAAVTRYNELQLAGIALQNSGNTDAVGEIAMEMADLKPQIEALTNQVEDLSQEARSEYQQYRGYEMEVTKALREHPRLKATAQMNRERERLQKEAQALAPGALTAMDAYRAVASGIGTKSEEFRALAEIRSGDVGRKAKIAQALADIKVQGILEEIRTLALGAGEPIIDAEVINRATAALTSDPIRGALPAPRIQTPATDEGEAEESQGEN